MLTQVEVKRLFDYDPATGELTYRVTRSQMRAGMRAGYNAKFARYVSIKGVKYIEAHIIWLWMTGALPKYELDHEDVNQFNNVWGNLREADDSANQANQFSHRHGRLKWTTLDPRDGRYYARVKWKGIQYSCGGHATELEAHNAAFVVAQRLHGSFVRR